MKLNQEDSTPMQFLDFESKIKSLFEQIEEMKNIESKSNISMSDKIHELEIQIEQEKIYVTENLTTWQKIQLSRHPNRPYTKFYVNSICDEHTEIFGDRNFKDDKAILCYLTKIDKRSVMVIGHQKGINTKMRQYRNFGMPNPEGYRKALRAMKMAEKFNIPIVTFIDTPGAFPGLEAEDRGQAEAIARNLFEMAKLKVPILCYVIGEGASGGALGIGVGDKMFMLQNTWFTVISPESCSSILWRSWDFKEKAAEALKLTPLDNLNNNIIDEIIEEPSGGAHHNPMQMAIKIKNHILTNLDILNEFDSNQRVKLRIERYNKMSTHIVE